jgi:hypothetical protein
MQQSLLNSFISIDVDVGLSFFFNSVEFQPQFIIEIKQLARLWSVTRVCFSCLLDCL